MGEGVEPYQGAILDCRVGAVEEAWGDSKAAAANRSIRRVRRAIYQDGPDFSVGAAFGAGRRILQITRPPWTTA